MKDFPRIMNGGGKFLDIVGAISGNGKIVPKEWHIS